MQLNGSMTFSQIQEEFKTSMKADTEENKVQECDLTNALAVLIKHDLVKAIFSDKHWNY